MPGKSGNPRGRPKQTQEQKDALKMIRDLAPEAAERLREILYDEKAKNADVLRAIEMIFDRAFGKDSPVTMQNELLQCLIELEKRHD